MLPFRHTGKPQTENISAYCSCRLPESDVEKMAACDRCSEWYHLSCERIPADVFQNSQVSWICSKCHTYAHACRLNGLMIPKMALEILPPE